jgi:putative phosphoribosyl transferase
MTGLPFSDRVDAGRRLGERLAARFGTQLAARLGAGGGPGAELVVLGLPRGGVPVAAEVARELNAPLDVLVIRKVGLPWQPELAIGAVGEGGVEVLNRPIVDSTGLSAEDVAELVAAASAEVAERVGRFRSGRSAIDLTGRHVVLVDDGIATGATMRAAIDVARARGATTVTVAVPVAAVQALDRLRDAADRVICLVTPSDLRGVGLWYRDFTQTADREVTALLATARGS